MRQPSFAVFSLLLLSPALIAAAPPAAHCSHTFLSVCHDRSRPAWRRLSDAIIGRIWGLPEEQLPLSSAGQLPPLVGDSSNRKLLARYGEDIVLRFNISSVEEAEALAGASDDLYLDVWESNENWVDIRIAKHVLPSLLGLLPKSLQNAHVPLMQNLDLTQAILDSYPSPSSTSHNDRYFSPSLKPSSHSENIFFQDYQPLSVITPWMSLMASMFPTHVRLINIGISYEGRDIPALHVGVHPKNNEQPSKPRKTILITGGAHAREWISTSTVNYVAWTLITSYGKDSHITHLLEAFDFVFIPTLNPDGYVYSWETDRLWRKNRQITSLRFCRGIDLDRSYAFQWDGDSPLSNPCSESYAGDAPFAGVEAQRFAVWAETETKDNNVEFVSLLDLHSYSQQILYPYSYSCAEPPPTIEALEELGFGLAKAMHSTRHGQPYQVTSACEGNVAVTRNPRTKKEEKIVLPRIEPSGGSALDWFYHHLKVRYTYQIKLRDTGSYGFLLPKENIVPTGKEMLRAVLYLGRFVQGQVGLGFEEETGEDAGEIRVRVEEVRQENVSESVEEERGSDEYEDEAMFELRRRRRR